MRCAVSIRQQPVVVIDQNNPQNVRLSAHMTTPEPVEAHRDFPAKQLLTNSTIRSNSASYWLLQAS